MSRAELRQIIGEFRDSATGKLRRIAWDMDILLYDGKQIATIDQVPGHPIRLMSQAPALSESQLKEIADTIAAKRGGVPPSEIKLHRKINGTILDDEDEGEDTEDELNDE